MARRAPAPEAGRAIRRAAPAAPSTAPFRPAIEKSAFAVSTSVCRK